MNEAEVLNEMSAERIAEIEEIYNNCLLSCNRVEPIDEERFHKLVSKRELHVDCNDYDLGNHPSFNGTTLCNSKSDPGTKDMDGKEIRTLINKWTSSEFIKTKRSPDHILDCYKALTKITSKDKAKKIVLDIISEKLK